MRTHAVAARRAAIALLCLTGCEGGTLEANGEIAVLDHPLAVCSAGEVEVEKAGLTVRPRTDVPLRAGGTFPDALQVNLPLRAGEVVLDLRRNDALFADSYEELEWDGTALVPSATPAERGCHYQGRVRAPDGEALAGGVAALSTCRGGLDGIVAVAGGFYALQAVEGTDAHRLTEITAPSLRSLLHVGEAAGAGASRWVQLLAVNDKRRADALGARVTDDTAAVVNIADALYRGGAFGRPIRVALAGQVTFSQGDPFAAARVGAEVSGNGLLQLFSDWQVGAGLPRHDNAALLSGDNFQGPTVGIAWVGTMCNGRVSASIVEDQASQAHTAAILAHEMGHNFGAQHDGSGNACAPTGSIMAASVCFSCPAPDDWSACSVQAVDGYLARTGGACLDDVPVAVGQDRCGDGLVTGAEACDCGGANCAGIDPCCNGATCQLAAGATCAGDDACCDPGTCRPLAAGTLCRGAAGTCDAAETCDGQGGTCPDDRGAADGAACLDARGVAGACADRRCVSYDAPCRALRPDATATGCEGFQRNEACGRLICNIGGRCYLFGDGAGGTVGVADGTPCGAGGVCDDGACSAADGCPADPNKTAPGVCGCGTPDTDADRDGTADCRDACPADAAKTAPGACGCGVAESPGCGRCSVPLASGAVLAGTAGWTRVPLPEGFTTPVVVATPQYANPTGPLVVRMRNVGAGGFDVRLAAPGGAAAANVTVRWIAVESGAYTAAAHGVTMEAARVTSRQTSFTGSSWAGEARAYRNAYRAPVVLGQVMTANDGDWSQFFAVGSRRDVPPSAGALRIGKHVGEDGDRTRANETLGYIVVEAGRADVCGRALAAGLSGDLVRGMGDAPPFAVVTGLAAGQAVLSPAGVDGTDGYWPVLYGGAALGADRLLTAADEDNLRDAERSHGTEQLGWLIIGR